MNKERILSEKQKDMFLIAALLTFFAVILVTGILYFHYATSHKSSYDAVPAAETGNTKEELLSLLSSQNVTVEKSELPETEIPEPMPEEQSEPIRENAEIVTDQAVRLRDIYSEKGEQVSFRCFDREAAAYVWEYYDIAAGKWQSVDETFLNSCPDELGRTVSMLEMKAEEDRDGFMVRCTIHFQAKEAEMQTASLYIIDEIKSIAIEDMETDANKYLGVNELPVTVTYQDGKDEKLTGLNGLHFITTEENTDHDMSVSGNRIETTTIVKTECEYLNTGLDTKEIPVRYRKREEEQIEAVCSITGRDAKPPEISEVKISPFEVSNVDRPINLTVTINAGDDVTPYPELEYAFLYGDQELAETDWTRKSSFDVNVERNGIYFAYVRDQSGNIGKLEKELITVDTKAPVIAEVSLSVIEDWCRYNTISVTARDAGKISYCYENESCGINSGWVTYSDYTADSNGIWTIKAKDAVGNISETEVTISNIDNEAPVIQRICAK